MASNNILQSIKDDLGIQETYNCFDSSIIGNINSVFMTLYQLGVGPEEPYSISTGDEEWSEFTNRVELEKMVRPYMYMRVRLMFDPPASSFLVESLSKQISEAEWRLNVAAETPSLGGSFTARDDTDV